MTKDTIMENSTKRQKPDLIKENAELREKVRELEETLDAIRSGEVDAIIVSKGDGQQIYTLEGADTPYRVLVENIREGALTLSCAGMILYANTRFAEMVKQPADKVVGTSIIDYICPEYQADVREALREIMKKTCRSSVRIKQEKGSLPVMISMNPLDHGIDTKISVVLTDRRKDEDRIMLQARMLDAVGDAVIAADINNRIIYWNEAATKTYGWETEEAIGRDLIDVATPEISKKDAREIAARLKKGDTWTGEYVVRHRDGHEFPIYASDAPVFDDDGTLIAVIGASHDISERKKSEKELKQKHEDLNAAYEEITATQEELQQNVDELMKREHELNDALAEKEILLSEIHHRVKNNLTAFISLLSLEGSYIDTSQGQALKKDLQNRARTMALIHETLYRTRQYSDVDMELYLSTLVDQIVNSYSSLQSIGTFVDAKGVTLDLGRATPIGLIINELVTNSLKYAFPQDVITCRADRKEPCTIGIRLTREDGMYLLKVSDNGIGLPRGLDISTIKSLGLKLVHFLARHQLRAKLEINRDNGTEFVFLFKERDRGI
jgi:PAS domain S-box-containing protein